LPFFITHLALYVSARAQLTFRYTENGPEGLLQSKKTYIVVASGGVPVGSPVGFATPYLRQALRAVCITEVEAIAADQLNQNEADPIDTARARIEDLVHTTEVYDSRTAQMRMNFSGKNDDQHT